jgi:uncharacterized membrane protein YgcG
MKAYAAIILLTLGFTSATAQQQLQPVPVAPPVTAADQQQVQQADAAVQAQPPQPAEPPQPQHIVLRVVGSQVRNQTGERLGLIEEVFVHRASGAVEYAIVSSSYPTNSSRQVPVPWGALAYVWDQSRAGGPSGANQVFILNMDARLLAQAPAIDRSRPLAIDQTLASARNFFGVPQAVGATGTPATGVTGAAAGQTGTATTPVTGGVVGQPVDNQVIVPGRNVPETPDRRVPHIDNNAPPAGGQSGNAPAQGTSGGTRSSGSGASGGSAGGSGGATGGGATGR